MAGSDRGCGSPATTVSGPNHPSIKAQSHRCQRVLWVACQLAGVTGVRGEG